MGLWFGSYQNQTQQWLRGWDSQGNSLLTGLPAYWPSQAIDQDLILALVVAVFFEERERGRAMRRSWWRSGFTCGSVDS